MPTTIHAPFLPPGGIAAVVCDMDGLLIDSEGIAIRCWQAALEPYGIDLPESEVIALFGTRIIDDAHLFVARYHLPVTPEQLVADRADLVWEIIPQALQPMPGALELISWLADHQIPLALATSGTAMYADLCLRTVGLDRYFAIRATGDEVQHGKPAPDIFLLAAQRLGIDPARCLVLEDAPNGVAAALAAGMSVVAVPNAHSTSLPFPAETYARMPSLVEFRLSLDTAEDNAQ